MIYTYVLLERGYAYLVAIIDWYSRNGIAWELSNFLDADFCLQALRKSFKKKIQGIFNMDQGVQVTCKSFIEIGMGAVAISQVM